MEKGYTSYMKKGYTAVRNRGTAVQEKKLARPSRKKADTAVYTEEMLTRPCTHSVHLLISVRLHIPACTLIRPRTRRVYRYRIRTPYVPTIQDCLCFSQINTWMWKKLLKTNLTWTIDNPHEKTRSCPDGKESEMLLRIRTWNLINWNLTPFTSKKVEKSSKSSIFF